MGSDEEFEHWLERDLKRTVRALQGSRPRAAQSAYRTAFGPGERWPTSKRPVASATAKAAAGIVAVALALGGGVEAATASTGSTNPMLWASALSQTVLGLPTPQPQSSEQPLVPVGPSASPNAVRIRRMTSPLALPTPQSPTARGTDADADPRPHPNCAADANSDAHADAQAHPNTYADANAGAVAVAYCGQRP